MTTLFLEMSISPGILFCSGGPLDSQIVSTETGGTSAPGQFQGGCKGFYFSAVGKVKSPKFTAFSWPCWPWHAFSSKNWHKDKDTFPYISIQILEAKRPTDSKKEKEKKT